jgi:hypothetical protein
MLRATLRSKKQLWLMFSICVLFICHVLPLNRSSHLRTCIIQLTFHDKHKTVYTNYQHVNKTLKTKDCCHVYTLVTCIRTYVYRY